MEDCGFSTELYLPCRRTFDRRLKTISTTDIKERIATMGNLFVSEDTAVNPHILATTDSTFIKANKGKVWHKSSMMEKGIVPHLGIDTMQYGVSVIPTRLDIWI